MVTRELKVEAFMPQNEVRVGRRSEHWIGGVEQRSIHDESIAHKGLHYGSSYLEHVRFLAAITDGGPVEVTLEDGLWSVAMGVAAHRSIEWNRPVMIEEVMA